MKIQSTIRLVLIAAALMTMVAYLSPAVLGQPAPAGGAAATPATDSPGKLSVLARLIIGHRDPVTYVIFALSIASLTFIIRGFLQARQEVVAPDATVTRIRDMIVNRQYQELLDFTETDPSFVSKSINPALKRAPHYPAMKEAMEIAVGEQTADAFRRIEILNIIGNLGPLLGLLGTVLGMIEAFDTMSRSNGPTNPTTLASGIATALAHTFLGLMLAIPTLAAFGILRTIVDRLTARAAIVSEELLSMMRPAGEAKPAPAGAATPVTTLPPRPAGVVR